MAELILRPYQQRLVDDICAAWQTTRNVLAWLPTGGGKTEIAGYFAKSVEAAGGCTLFVVDRKTLAGERAGLPFRRLDLDAVQTRLQKADEEIAVRVGKRLPGDARQRIPEPHLRIRQRFAAMAGDVAQKRGIHLLAVARDRHQA